MFHQRSSVLRACFVLLATWSAATHCFAEFRHWRGAVDGFGEFTNPASWVNGVPTNNTTSDVALFYGFFLGPPFATVNLSVERSVRGLAFLPPEDLGLPIDFTFTGSTLHVGEDGIDIENGAGGSQTINNHVRLGGSAEQRWTLINSNLYLNGPLSGSPNLYKAGSGTLILTGSNSNTGRTGVLEGLLLVTGSGRLSDTSNVEVGVNGTLALDGMTDAINGLYGSGLVQLVDSATLVVGNSINDSQGIGYFQGLIEGVGGKLFKRGPETFGLGTGNTYTGGTQVESGMLLIDNSSGSATGSGHVEVFGGWLTGGGTISGRLTAYSGAIIAPGHQTLLVKDSLLSVGDFDMRPGAILEIKLGGRFPGENTDTLATADATIAGSLSVSLLPGFTPDYGDVFEILTADFPILGTFAGLPQGALVGNLGGTDLYIDYTGNGGRQVNLRAIAPGDFDFDGDVDGRDFLEWQQGNSPNPLSADDLSEWQANYGTSSLVEAVAVPEPSTGFLAILVAAVMVCCNKFRTAAATSLPA